MIIVNWYKIAFVKKAMNYKELFNFYALQGLDDHTLQNNPTMLFSLIDVVRELRLYYLRHLLNEISSELQYAKAAVISFGDRYSYKGMTTEELVSYLVSIQDILKKDSSLNSVDRSIQSDVIQIFFEPIWVRGGFGGSLWGEISRWTFELLNIGEISQQVFNSSLIAQLRKAVYIIDVINSLEHNSGLVLNSMPQGEYRWLRDALDVVFDSPNPVYLSDLAGNTELSEVYRREVLPLQQQREFEQKIYSLDGVFKMLEDPSFTGFRSDMEKLLPVVIKLLKTNSDPYLLYYIFFKKQYFSTLTGALKNGISSEDEAQLINKVLLNAAQIENYIISYQDGVAAYEYLFSLAGFQSGTVKNPQKLAEVMLLDCKRSFFFRDTVFILNHYSINFTKDFLDELPACSILFLKTEYAHNLQKLDSAVLDYIDSGKLERKIVESQDYAALRELIFYSDNLVEFEDIQRMVLNSNNVELMGSFVKHYWEHKSFDLEAFEDTLKKKGGYQELFDLKEIPDVDVEEIQDIINRMKRDEKKYSPNVNY